MEIKQIIIFTVIFGIIFLIMWIYKTELSSTKYKKATVKQVQDKNICNKIHAVQSYFIEYERYFLGFIPITVKFYEEECGWGDCYKITVTSKSVEGIIKKFNKHVKEVRKAIKSKKIQDIKNLCDE